MQRLLILASFSTLLFTACSQHKTETAETVQAIDTIPLLVTQVQQCSRLYTTSYKIHKIITHNDEVKVEGTFMKRDFSIDLPLGERRIAIPIDATIKAYIDLSTFSASNIHRNGDKINITLPDPRIIITASKIDHKDIREYVALTRRNFSDAELSNYEKQGRKQIENAIPQMGIIEQAQKSAARQLVPLFTALGYKEENIVISFRKKFSIHDLPQLLDSRKEVPNA